MRGYPIADAALLGASAASAAEFTGPWVELRGGFDSIQLKASGNDASVSANRSSLVCGAAAGYDLAIGANASASVHIGGYGTTTKVCAEVYGNDDACLKAARDSELLARLGFKPAPTFHAPKAEDWRVASSVSQLRGCASAKPFASIYRKLVDNS